MRRVLVTGASGLIGRQAVGQLVSRADEVHAVARRPASRPDGVHWHDTDLLDDAAAAALVEAVAPTHVLHLAWTTEHGRFWSSPANLSWVAASARLLELAGRHGAVRWVGAGTCAEYAVDASPCVEGTTPLRPDTLYGTAKDATRRVLEAAAGELGMTTAWGRVFFLHGPGEDPHRLVPSIVNALLAGTVAECTPGTQVRDFLHSADVAAAFVHLLGGDLAGAVNIGSGQPTSIAEVANRIGDIVGRPDLVHLGARPLPESDAPAIVADVRRLAGSGWRPDLDLDAGLARTVEWWREQRAS